MSSLICVFDTETTGFPNFKAPSDHPDQPHIVDICALLYTPEGDLVDSFEAMVRPDGWSIPNEVSVIHGITNEMALEHGIPEAVAIEGFLNIWNQAGLRVAHNVSFDDRIMRIGLKRFQDAWVAESYREAPQVLHLHFDHQHREVPAHRKDDRRRPQQAAQAANRHRSAEVLHR